MTFTQWHIEDKGLGALNHLFWGAPKLWLLALTPVVMNKLIRLLNNRYRGKTKGDDLFYGKELGPYKVSLQEALECGFVPFVQQPGMVVYTHSLSGVHVTMSSGISMAIASNCFFGPDLKAHFDKAKNYTALNKGNHKAVGDYLIKCLKMME